MRTAKCGHWTGPGFAADADNLPRSSLPFARGGGGATSTEATTVTTTAAAVVINQMRAFSLYTDIHTRVYCALIISWCSKKRSTIFNRQNGSRVATAVFHSAQGPAVPFYSLSQLNSLPFTQQGQLTLNDSCRSTRTDPFLLGISAVSLLLSLSLHIFFSDWISRSVSVTLCWSLRRCVASLHPFLNMYSAYLMPHTCDSLC